MLFVTAVLLAFSYLAMPGERKITFGDAIIIGITQAIAVLTGLSRSGSSIVTSLLVKNKREDAAKFSFLMVIFPIAGKAILDLVDGVLISEQIALTSLLTGFLASFIVGLLACRLMIGVVKKSKLIYFAIYRATIAIFTMLFSW